MDCPSCGAIGQTKARCEACGFTFPMDAGGDVDDGALSLFLGLVCGTCDAYNDPGTLVCLSCGAALQLDAGQLDGFPDAVDPSSPVAEPGAPAGMSSAVMTAPPSWMTPPSGSPLSTQFAMKKVDLAVVTGAGPAGLAAPVAPPSSSSPSSSSPLSAPVASGPGPLSALPTAPTTASPSFTASPSPSPSPPSQPTPAVVKEICWRCNRELELNDKFCRNCGARTDGGVGSAPTAQPPPRAGVTQMIASLKLPAPPAGPGAPGATMVLPALKLGVASSPAHGGGGPTATLMFGAATAERVA